MELKNTEKLEHSQVKLTVAVSAEELDKAKEAAYKKSKNQFQIPGFRKGKATRKVIERLYGKDFFVNDAINNLYPEMYPQALEAAGIEPVGQGDVKIDESLENFDNGFDFIFTVPVYPEVSVGTYKGVEAEKADATVTEDDVNAELNRLAERAASTETADRAAALGDTVVIDFEGFVDGEAFEGGKGEDFSLKLGSGTFIPGFEDQLVGKSAGEDCDVNVTFPEEYHAKELAGKPAVFKCTVHSISVKELPELDDEFAQEVSEFDTLDEYKADVKKNLEEKKAADAKTAKENAAVDKAVENAQMDIPEPMIDSQVEQMINDYARRLQSQGLSMEQYMQFTGTTMDALKEQVRPQALTQIKTRLVLEKIAEVEDIQISDEKLDEELAKMAESYKM